MVKRPLVLTDGTLARSLEELREHVDLESLISSYRDGRLQRWLIDYYFDNEAEKIKTIKDIYNTRNLVSTKDELKEIVQVLAINSIDDEQIKNLDNIIQNKTDVEDNDEIKSQLRNSLDGMDLNLDDWTICTLGSENKDMCSFLIKNKKTGMDLNIELENTSSIYKRLLLVLNSLEITNRIKSVNSEIAEIFTSSVGENVHFGKLDWIIAKKNVDVALLICSRCIVDYMRFSETIYNINHGLPSSYKWLNSDFLKDFFSAEEILCLGERRFWINDSYGFEYEPCIYAKIFLPTVEDIISLPSGKIPKMTERNPNHWCWLGDGNKVYFREDGTFSLSVVGSRSYDYLQTPEGIVPAILVKMR